MCASVVATHAQVRPETVAAGLENPWGVAFLPDGRFLVTEKAGRLRVVSADGRIGAALEGLPAVAAGGQGGLLDVATDSAFATNRTVYICFSEPQAGGASNSTALARAHLSADSTRLEGVQVVFSQKPKVSSSAHFGCRIVEAKDGTLFLTLGDRFSRKEDAQKLDNHIGKVIRIQKDGTAPKDNPFVGRAGALPEIWSYGHRNGQGATLGPDGRLWMHEHGPQGGDEINAPQAGKNYGWPVITYGENYGGGKIGDGLAAKDGMEQPLHFWVPSIAPSGMAFLTSDRYGSAWKGNLFVGSLKFGYLDRIEWKGGKVVAEHKLLEEGRARIRDVKQGPDGLLYVLTDERDGKLLRLQPR
ncbi:PQQ-dependent sugar dehydrogenase [Variovorax guangxiensis]|uniref:PQQ-dependent sugar dehydrogenase n=1 Tax=Variovorax guangxiensis TaxID=1775474 RepID=A0A502DR42_9BURK|nr:PQQ-dependent sugar dehydrogenase [Variovorax guangxiensis]RZI69380.1 MAG: PQQ-dependent sugar dehydrogenase [Variovorax sp.]TPG23006.1 PQQ-dependent sugar dehydrogenase [Variovorax ginsengisoli]TPG27554.1 PQQ-dependent sugar dehydrogenase [Variovorax guangxiensis]